MPVVAAVQGTALGAGTEIALACHYRVAHEGARFGLPELSLGIIPGAGGTQRLPRLVPLEVALDMALTGKPLPAAKAAEAGLADRVVGGDVIPAAVAYARELVAGGAGPRRTREQPVKGDAGRGGIVRRQARPGRQDHAQPAVADRPDHGVAGRGGAAVRRRPEGRRPAVVAARAGHRIEGAAPPVLRRARSAQDPGPGGEHRAAADRPRRHRRRRHHGRRHCHVLRQCRHSGHAGRCHPAEPRSRPGDDPQELRALGLARQPQAGTARGAHQADHPDAGLFGAGQPPT